MTRYIARYYFIFHALFLSIPVLIYIYYFVIYMEYLFLINLTELMILR